MVALYAFFRRILTCMSLGEFQLIDRYFARAREREDFVVGIGDAAQAPTTIVLVLILDMAIKVSTIAA